MLAVGKGIKNLFQYRHESNDQRVRLERRVKPPEAIQDASYYSIVTRAVRTKRLEIPNLSGSRALEYALFELSNVSRSRFSNRVLKRRE